MTLYTTIKHAHLLFVTVSLLLFSYRAYLSLKGVPWRQRRWLLVVPHINDTLLLVCGVTLAALLHLSPIAHPWLALKLALLVGYVLAGKWALSPDNLAFGKRLLLTVMAWGQFATMIWLAINKPFGG